MKKNLESDSEFIKFQQEEQGKSRFSKYINDDLKVFKSDVEKIKKQVMKTGKIDAAQKMVIDDLKRKGLVEFGEMEALLDGKAVNFSDADGYAEDGKGRSKSRKGVKGKGVKGRNGTGEDSDDDEGGDGRGGSKGKKKGGMKGKINYGGMNNGYAESESSDSEYLDANGKPLPPDVIKAKKAKKAAEMKERMNATGAKNAGDQVVFAKDKKANLKNKSMVDETCVEGGKLLGVRSEAYTITRGGVRIKVHDMGTGTEISGNDMENGQTTVNVEQLTGKPASKAKNAAEALPNVEAKTEIDPITGEKLTTFTLKSSMVLKVKPSSPEEEAEITKGGLRRLVEILCKEVGLDEVFQMAKNRQMNNMNNSTTGSTRAGTNRSGKGGPNGTQGSMSGKKGYNDSSMFGSEIIDEDYDGEPMYSEKSLDPNEVLAPVMNQKIIKNKDGTKTIIKQLEDGRIVREVVDKNGKVIKKTISEEPVNAETMAERRADAIQSMTPAQKRAIDKVIMALKNVEDEELHKVVVKILDLLKGVQKISAAVAKQLDRLPEEAKAAMTDLAKELESAGGPGITLDLTTVDQKDLDILAEKPPPVRKMNDLQLDKAGNLVDEDGNIVISQAQNANLVKDKDGNMVDKVTGKVVFNADGELVADKIAVAKHTAKKEAVKKKIMQQQMKAHLKKGGKIEGMVLDKDGKLKVKAPDGTLIDAGDDNPEIDMDKLVADEDGNLINPETGEVVVDKNGNYVGSKVSDMGNLVKAAKSGDYASMAESMKNLGGTEFLKKHGNSFAGHMTEPKNKFAIRHGVGPKGAGGFQFTEEGKDQRQIDAELRNIFQSQLNELPSMYEDEKFDKDGNKIINDAYNPLLPENANNPEFYRNLFKAFKMTRLAQSENLRPEHLNADGLYHPNYESEEFDKFVVQVKKFSKMHGTCGEFCKHLLRFYAKLGFFPKQKYSNQQFLKLPKLNMDNDFTKVRSEHCKAESSQLL